MESNIVLTDEQFIGKGANKKVYYYPGDKNRCVKILYVDDTSDYDREMTYRQMLGKKHRKTTMLPQYFGVVSTNLGSGHVYECVNDFDGQRSAKILDYISGHLKNSSEEEIVGFLLKLRNLWQSENIVTTDADPNNFVVQRLSENEYTFRILDNVGVVTFIPLALWFDFVAKIEVRKRWKRFIKNVIKLGKINLSDAGRRKLLEYC